jgi:phosphopantothenoylcysteine decarboxylase/phosphopantothenate--cysteine ligase
MEPEHILTYVEDFFLSKQDFNNKKILITMGPTQEAIDPVRFISNHSSGKMGLALAKAFKDRGAEVFVISGPISLNINKDSFHWIDVKSANEMYNAAKKLHNLMDICVFAAAVADYAPSEIASEKIKKSDSELTLKMVKNVDIAFELGKIKQPGQLHVGFALETENETENAKAKLDKKNFDLIVLNSMKESGAGFQLDTNRVHIFQSTGQSVSSEVANKSKIADLILDQIKLAPIWV